MQTTMREAKSLRVQAEKWLALQDSNLGMPVPKTGALPLGEGPPTQLFPI